MCALTQPDDAPELAHLSRKWMKPHQLIEVKKMTKPECRRLVALLLHAAM